MDFAVSFRPPGGRAQARKRATVTLSHQHSASSYGQAVVVGEDGEAVDSHALALLDYRLDDGQSSAVRAAWDAVVARCAFALLVRRCRC